MKFKPIIAWYYCWVGFYYSRAKNSLYFFPIPCIGIVIILGNQSKLLTETNSVEILQKDIPKKATEFSKYEDCDVEYMPISKRYYPRYMKQYLRLEQSSGGYETRDWTHYSIYRMDEESAWIELDKFLELKGTDTIILKR